MAACEAKTRETRFRKSVIATVSKTQLVSQLFKLLWWSQKEQETPSSLSDSPKVKALADLYKSVLSFQMRATTQSDMESPLYIRDLKDSDLDLSLSEEVFMKTFSEGLLSSQLEQYLDANMKDNSAAVNEEVKKAMAKLHVDRPTVSVVQPDQSHVMGNMWRWAEETVEFKEFLNWDDRSRGRVLWVDGFAGAGKSTLLRKAADCLAIPSSHEPKRQVVHFFFDDTRWRQGNVLSVVKELICGLLVKQPQDLFKYMEHILDEPVDFETEESVPILSRILIRMILDENFCSTYFLVDGLEQFVPDLDHPIRVANNTSQDKRPGVHSLQTLLNLIVTTVDLSDKVKWLLSTDRGHCDASLVFDSPPFSAAADLQTILVLGRSMPDLVQDYAARRVRDLVKESDFSGLGITAIIKKRLEQAPANFLWINVAFDMLTESATPWSIPDLLSDWIEKDKTTGHLFKINLSTASLLWSKDKNHCEDLLWYAATAYRPLPITELRAIIKLPAMVQIPFLVRKFLPAFFEMSDQRLHYRHLSARAFIRNSMSKKDTVLHHRHLAQRCIEIVLKELECTQAETNPDTFTSGSDVTFEYIGTMWPRHLAMIYKDSQSTNVMGLAEHLLSVHLIDWLHFLSKKLLLQEAMSAMRYLTDVVSADVSLTPSITQYHNCQWRPSLLRILLD